MDSIVCYDIINIDNEGITLKHSEGNVYICFKECANNYAIENMLNTSNCVATRNISTLSFVFYTVPRTQVVFRKNFLRTLVCGKSAIIRFHDLQKAIVNAGYTSYDLS